jgi:hypothetical protein
MNILFVNRVLSTYKEIIVLKFCCPKVDASAKELVIAINFGMSINRMPYCGYCKLVQGHKKMLFYHFAIQYLRAIPQDFTSL